MIDLDPYLTANVSCVKTWGLSSAARDNLVDRKSVRSAFNFYLTPRRRILYFFILLFFNGRSLLFLSYTFYFMAFFVVLVSFPDFFPTGSVLRMYNYLPTTTTSALAQEIMETFWWVLRQVSFAEKDGDTEPPNPTMPRYYIK